MRTNADVRSPPLVLWVHARFFPLIFSRVGSARRFVILRTRRQPFFLGALQRAGSTGARFGELRRLLGVAGKQIRQRERRIDLGNDAVDARDLGLGFGYLLFQRDTLFASRAGGLGANAQI